jgi:hypothetical protein
MDEGVPRIALQRLDISEPLPLACRTQYWVWHGPNEPLPSLTYAAESHPVVVGALRGGSGGTP